MTPAGGLPGEAWTMTRLADPGTYTIVGDVELADGPSADFTTTIMLAQLTGSGRSRPLWALPWACSPLSGTRDP